MTSFAIGAEIVPPKPPGWFSTTTATATRGLFAGWVRGLAFVAIASLGVTLLLSIQVAVMQPWLVDVLNRRITGDITPRAPTHSPTASWKRWPVEFQL